MPDVHRAQAEGVICFHRKRACRQHRRRHLATLRTISTRTISRVHRRAPRSEVGDYLFAGPGWNGDTPKGIGFSVRKRSSSAPSRARLDGTRGPRRSEYAAAIRDQAAQRIHRGQAAGTGAAVLSIPAWDEARQFDQFHSSSSRARLTTRKRHWIVSLQESDRSGLRSDAATFDPATRSRSRLASRKDKTKLQAAIAKTTSSVDLFSTREFLGRTT